MRSHPRMSAVATGARPFADNPTVPAGMRSSPSASSEEEPDSFESVLSDKQKLPGTANDVDAPTLVTFSDGTTLVQVYDLSSRLLTQTLTLPDLRVFVKTFVYGLDGSVSWSYS